MAEDDRAGELALVLDDVSVHFGGVAALARVSFTLAAGETLAVVGPNGAGKSTILNAVSGLIRQNVTGSIELYGDPILGKPPVAIARRGVGRSFQDPPLISSETVLENVLVGEHLRLGYRMVDQLWRRRRVREAEAAARRRVVDILEMTGVGHLANQVVGGLPYGTRKLVDIARAIASKPRVLLLDEPTSGLDGDERAAVGELIKSLHRSIEVGIVVVEHHMEVVRTVADRVVGLGSGLVIMVGAPETVLDSAEFQAALVGGHDLAAASSPAASSEAENGGSGRARAMTGERSR